MPLIAPRVMDGATILGRAREVGPLLRESAAEGEAARRLTGRVVDALRSTGVFRMAMPKAWGGSELDLCSQIEIIEALSRADGSAGWCAMIGSDGGYYASYLDAATARSLYPEVDAVTAGFLAPAGRLDVCHGGYRLSGRWSFGSGVNHADVIVGGAHVFENGSPRLNPSGVPERRVVMLPASRWEVLDTWNSTGLAASGSHDYTISETFVPTENTWVPGQRGRPEPLYSWLGLAVCNFVGVPLGIAAEACDVASDILARKVSRPSGIPATDEPHVRVAIAKSRAMVGSARSYAYDAAADLWEAVVANGMPSFEQRARVAGCKVHTVTACRDAVQLLVDTLGTAAIQKGGPLERQLRDLNAVAQHGIAQQRVWQWAGGLYFGDEPPNPVF